MMESKLCLAPLLAQFWDFPLRLHESIFSQGILLEEHGCTETGRTSGEQHSLAATLGTMSCFDNIPVDGGKIF